MRHAVLFLAFTLHAGTITTLYNTGGATQKAIDPNWTVNGGDAYVTDETAFPFVGLLVPWTPNNSVSSWISPQGSYAGGGSDPGGLYIYSTQFDLTGYDLASVIIEVNAEVDNQILDMRINGTSAHVFPFVNAFVPEPPFILASGFLEGLNRLDFVTYNIPQLTPNPNGLNVWFDSSGSLTRIPDAPDIPEPATILLIGAGLIAIASLSKRRPPNRRVSVLESQTVARYR